MSHFTKEFTDKKGKGKKIEYRFDFYEQTNNSIAYKDDFDNCPELDLDFGEVCLKELRESKPAVDKEDNKKYDCFYYPGFTLKISTVRDPFSKIVRVFLPAMIIGVFLFETFDILEFHDRLNNISICLLTYIGIMQNMRSELPEISKLTYADTFLITWATASLFPIFDRLIGFPSSTSPDPDDQARESDKLAIRGTMKLLILLLGIICTCWLFYMYFSVRAKLN